MPRQKKNTARTNLVISVILHGLAVLVLFVFAAREGAFGTKMKEIAVVIVPKEKPPEPPKETPPEPKVEPPKADEPAKEEPAKAPEPEPVKVAAANPNPAPPPAGDGNAIAAPAAAIPADFSFSDGAKVVGDSAADPIGFYRNFAEYTLRSNWTWPEDLLGENLVGEIEVLIDTSGNILNYLWKTKSGNKRWDESIKKALDATKTISRVPPKDFPRKFTVRFDVAPAAEPLLQ